MNISSIVVQTKPQFLDEVIQNLKDSKVCDYHMHDEKGRIIITIEGNGVQEELKKLKVIEAIPHIISADMQMTYSEDELSNHIDVLENSDAVPKVLNDETIKPENVTYNGDLKKRDVQAFAKQFDNANK